MRLFKKKPRCPYCELELDKKPTRKKKCPNCSEYIIVRRGELYTEEQAEIMDQVGILEQFGASQEMFEEEREELSKQFGLQASVRDTLWKMMNSLIPQQERSVDKELLYMRMAYFVEEEGRDPSQLIEQAMQLKGTGIKREVLEYKELLWVAPEARVKVHTRNDDIVCDRCNEISKRTYNIDDFLKKMPIPNNCSNPRGCRCNVAIELD